MNILPKPQKVQVNDTKQYILSYDSQIVIDQTCERAVYPYVQMLQASMKETLGYTLAITRGSSKFTAVTLQMNAELQAQQYTLTIDEKGVFLQASTNEGMLYAVQTLRQLIKEYGAALPFVAIDDWPEIDVRGYYLDVTRGRIPQLSYLKQYIDKLAMYKINQLHLYMEHSFLFEGLSEVWRDDTPLTANDILEIDDYCAARNIELVPSIATFGHLYKVLRTQKFRHLCEMPDLVDDAFGFVDRMEHHTLDITNEASFEFVTSLMAQFIPLFRSKKFNICGDETFDLGKGRSKSVADEIGEQELYVQFLAKICTYLVEQQITPLFWGDIIVNAPENLGRLPQEAICLSWGYAADQDDHSVKTVANAGAKQYCCPGVSGWDQLVNQFEVSFENIQRMCQYAKTYQAQGLLNTDWGDCGHLNHPDMSIPGMIYGAALSWNQATTSFAEMNEKISQLEFENVSGEVVAILAEIPTKWVFKWRDLVNLKEDRLEAVDENQIDAIQAAIVALTDLSKKIIQVTPKLDSSQRHRLLPYLIAIDGMKLLQELGITLILQQKESQFSNQGLSERIEEWFMAYKNSWREVSQEAELYRIQEVFFWASDKIKEK
ncbi:family 20 glycosylhydrolase [Enterococcus sp.]|uniref:family 20 glycosylhydrolase n=1 Tax=Enterococcus sp. TaxID=35783 RepID=UPI002FC5968B